MATASTDQYAEKSKPSDPTIEEISQVKTNETGTTGDVAAAEKGENDHVAEQHVPMTLRRFMPLVAMAFLWTGSQIPLYLFGGIPPYIYQDIGGADRWIWFVLGNLLALASICPFVGSLSDLFGRRYVAMMGASFLIIGLIVSSTAHSMNIFIAGMSIAGVGAGINELTALAVTSEIAPTRKRGLYNAGIVLTIFPYCPSQLWGQLVAAHSTWRYIGLWCGLWVFVGLVLVVIFYHPPPRANSYNLSRKETLRRIDFIGGLLSISGMLLFMMGLQWGGYGYPWASAHVLVTLLLGALLIALFFVWEIKFAKFPMFPRAIMRERRIVVLTLIITCISGANFFSILLFWPTQSYNVYGHDPVDVGLRGISLGFAILAGACIVLSLLTFTRGHIRELMLLSTACMTAGCGATAALTVDHVWPVWVVLTIAGLGIGGIVVPASIITQIVCPPELIATVTALTLAIRVIGGAIGYCIYYNVFYNKFIDLATNKYLVPQVIELLPKQVPPAELKVLATEVIEITASGILPLLQKIPGLQSPEAYAKVVYAGQVSYAHAYSYVYYVSIAFGGVSIICAALLGNIERFMTDNIAAAY